MLPKSRERENEIMGRQHKYRSVFHKMVVYTFSVFMCVIVVLLLFCSKSVDYSYKRLFLTGNMQLLCCGIFVGVGLVLGRKTCGRIYKVLEKNSQKAISRLTMLLILGQIYVCYNAYFYTGWDVAVLIQNAFSVAEGESLMSTLYFSSYPNNVLLLAVFSIIRKVDLYFGILDVREGIMGILCVQCFLSGLTGYLLFQIVQNFAGCWGAWCGWFCYLVLVGTSGWLMIPYSDSMGLFFPTMLLYLYVKLQNGKYVRLKWVVMGMLSCLGYHIKPQIFITFIAIVIVEICSMKPKTVEEGVIEEGRNIEKSPKKTLQNSSFTENGRLCRWGLLYALAGIVLASILYSCLVRDITRQLDEEKAFGISHFVMMGLNTVNNGGYLGSDVEFSWSFATKEERTEANVQVIGQRLKEMGFGGLGVHAVRKLLTDYGDGTFAWKMEGTFFSHVYEPKNNFISLVLRNIIWGDGKANALNETIRQGVWLSVLAASLGMIGYRKKADPVLALVLLAVIGLTLFELLFEARARYLYIYVPFYIITGVLGGEEIVKVLQKRAGKNIS